LAVIYLGRTLPSGSSHLHGNGRASHISLHGVAADRVYRTGLSPAGRWALTSPFHPYQRTQAKPVFSGGIFLLHFSWSRLRRVLPATLALRSPDFPHVLPFDMYTRLPDLLTSEYFTSWWV